MGPRRRFELHRYSRHGGGLSGRHRHPARGDRIPHAAPSSAGPAEGGSPGRGRPCRGRSLRAAGRERRARDFAATLAALRENLPGEFLQIDFEAKSSQRDFFVKAVAALRQRLPDAVLSATALTSWCLNERWTQSLAVDEVVPMLFRLGPDRRRIRDYFADGGDFRSSNCRTSIGVATDELPPAIPAGRRIYAFSPRRWNAETYATLRERIRQWSDASRLY